MQHPYLQRHTQRTRLLWLLVAACIAGAAFLVWTAETAAAHRATLDVAVRCQESDGSWVASWSLSNSEARKLMSVSDESVTDFAPNPVPFSGTAHDSTTHANSVFSVTASVVVDWPAHGPLSYSLTAFRPDTCQVPPTTTTTQPGTPPVTTEIGTAIQIVRVPPVPAILQPDFTG